VWGGGVGARARVAPYAALCLLEIWRLTRGPAATYLASAELQPSTFASLGLAAALALGILGRPLASGIALALGGVFHVSFLIVGLPTLAMAQAFLGPERIVRRWAEALLPPLLVLAAVHGPILWSFQTATGGARSLEIFHTLRAPHHYAPWSFAHEIWVLGGWTLMGIAGLLLWSEDEDHDLTHRAFAFWAAAHTLVWGGALVSLTIHWPKFNQLFLWRMAPFAHLLSAMALLTGVCLWAGHRARSKRALLAAVSIVAGAVHVAAFTESELVASSFGVWMALGAVSAVAAGLVRAKRHALALIPAVAVVVAAAWTGIELGRTFDTFKKNLRVPAAEQQLYDWMQHHTPNDALFLAPPQLARFRVFGRRSEVVDWKTLPVMPEETLEWHARLEAISGVDDPQSKEAIVEGYAAIDAERMRSLDATYDLDYAVVPAERAATLEDAFLVLFVNDAWAVIDLSQETKP